MKASSQDGSVGRHGSPALTTTSKSQLKYRTTITQKCPKLSSMKSDNYGIKETMSIQTVGGVQTWNGLDCTLLWCIKIWEGYLGSKESQPHTRSPAQGYSARKVSPHNFWLQKPTGIESVGKNHWSPSQFLLKSPHTDSPTQTHSL